MMNKMLFALLLLVGKYTLAQQTNLYFVKLSSWAKDEQFNKLQLIMPFYEVLADTVESNDFENMRTPQKIAIRKPAGFVSYAYAYFFFNGANHPNNPGQVPVLMVNYKERNPQLFIDYNVNYDFTDDGNPIRLPMVYNKSDSLVVTICRTDKPTACNAVKLERMNFINQYAYKNLLNEYYDLYYKERKFIGIDYCFREQRYHAREGIVKTATDSFRVALIDVNYNGIFNEPGIDKIATANLTDSIIESKDEMRSMLIPENREDWVVEKNGIPYQFVQLDEAGDHITLRELPEFTNQNRLPLGKKVPSFMCIDWKGTKHKLKKFRKKQVYIYYTGTYTKNFEQDTMLLRKLSTDFQNELQVIGFLDVNRSYELSVFGTYSNLNWIAAYKNKYITRDLKLRGIPSSMWLGKRRKLKAYNLTPAQLYELMSKEPS